MKDDKNNKLEWSAFWDELKSRIRDFYPYFLGFYLLCLLIAIFSHTWRGFFNWPGLHGSFLLFTLLFLATFRFDLALKKADLPSFRSGPIWGKFNFASFRPVLFLKKPDFSFFYLGLARLRVFSRQLGSFIRRLTFLLVRLGRQIFFAIWNRLRKISWRGWLKIAVVALVLVAAIWNEADTWELLVAFYAAVSILYALDSRLSAGAALIYLTTCPLLLFLDRPRLAESAAVYAFYFLVITVVTQMRELRQDQTQNQPD